MKLVSVNDDKLENRVLTEVQSCKGDTYEEVDISEESDEHCKISILGVGKSGKYQNIHNISASPDTKTFLIRCKKSKDFSCNPRSDLKNPPKGLLTNYQVYPGCLP